MDAFNHFMMIVTLMFWILIGMSEIGKMIIAHQEKYPSKRFDTIRDGINNLHSRRDLVEFLLRVKCVRLNRWMRDNKLISKKDRINPTPDQITTSILRLSSDSWSPDYKFIDDLKVVRRMDKRTIIALLSN